MDKELPKAINQSDEKQSQQTPIRKNYQEQELKLTKNIQEQKRKSKKVKKTRK